MGRKRILDLMAQLQEHTEPMTIEAEFAAAVARQGKGHGKKRLEELLRQLQG